MNQNLNRHHPMNPQPRLRLAGFTLTEVLVVILIIAVLAAIMFPLVRGIRERAHSAVCAQNLKQIGIGLHAYISENSGRFPDGSADVSWTGKGTCWYDAASQIMGRDNPSRWYNDRNADPLADVFGCPSGHGKAYHPAWPFIGDYAANWALGNASEVKTMSAVKNPSSTPYVQDTVYQNNFASGTFRKGASKQAWKNKSTPSGPNSDFADRHGGSGNILWVDGHVSSMMYSEYMDFATSPARGGAGNFIRGNW